MPNRQQRRQEERRATKHEAAMGKGAEGIQLGDDHIPEGIADGVPVHAVTFPLPTNTQVAVVEMAGEKVVLLVMVTPQGANAYYYSLDAAEKLGKSLSRAVIQGRSGLLLPTNHQVSELS